MLITTEQEFLLSLKQCLTSNKIYEKMILLRLPSTHIFNQYLY